MSAGKIALRPAEERDRELIKNIFNLYQNELSEYTSDFTYLDENGYFTCDMVNEILPYGGGVYPHIITNDEKNVGFVMFTDKRYAPSGADYCLEELFVIRPVRGRGAAMEAMHRLTENRPGVWSLDVYRENARARAFWEKFMTACAGSFQTAPAPDGFVRYVFTVPARCNEKGFNTHD